MARRGFFEYTDRDLAKIKTTPQLWLAAKVREQHGKMGTLTFRQWGQGVERITRCEFDIEVEADDLTANELEDRWLNLAQGS